MNRIKCVSLFFRIVFQAMFIGLPLLLVIAWTTSSGSFVLMNGAINISFIPRAYMYAVLHVLSPSEKVLGLCVSAIPVLIELYIVYALIQLFKLYENGEIFSLNNVRYFRNIGYALLIGQLINPVVDCLMGVVLTWHNPSGHRFAAFIFDQSNLGVLFMALLVVLISWVMAEGCKLREEQQLTI